MSSTAEMNQARQRRIRRSVFWLTAVALAFYVVFIVLAVSRARG